jgi:ribonuclease P protein component
MISKQHRFHGYTSLSYVYRHGSTVRNQQLAIKYVRNGRQASYRAAVVVGRKVQKSAVVRNLIRRRLYEIIRTHQAGIVEPYDLVLTVFSEQVAELPAAKLSGQVVGLLNEAGILKTRPEPQRVIVKKQSNSVK